MRRAALVATVAALLAATPAWPLAGGSGTISVERTRSGFDAAATLRQNGRLVRVAGPITCTDDMAIRIRVTLTQRKTGALGTGTWRGLCTGTTQRWTLKHVRASGETRFAAGRARACAAAVLRNSEGPVDAAQWCRTLRLKRP